MTAADPHAALVPLDYAAESRTGPLNTALRAARNAAIAAARARGEAWREIAGRYGLSERQARRARDDHVASRAGALVPLADPNEALSEAIEVHREVVVEARRLAREGDNANARVGALRVQAEASRKLLDLLAWGGLVPDTEAAWRFTRDVQRFTAAVVEECQEAGVDVSAVLERLERVPGYMAAMGYGAADAA